LKRYELQFEQLLQVKFAMDVQLQDPRLLTLAFRFYNLMCDFCLKVARGDAAGSITFVAGFASKTSFRGVA